MADTLKSADVPSVHGVVVVNPDGTSISGGTVNGVAAFADSGGTDRKGLVDADRHVQVDVLTMPAGGSGLTDLELRASPVVVDLGANNDVTVTSGTVTANLGATDNAVLDAIETDTTSIDSKTPALGQALAAGSVPVVLTAAQVTTLTPPAAITGFATAANQLPDGHNVTVDNASLAVTGTFWQATQPVSGTVTANLSATDNAVLDTIDSNTDSLAVTGGGVELGALRVTLANDSTGVLSVDDNGGSLTVDGTVAVTGVATAANQTTVIGHLDGVEGLLTTMDADTGGILTAVQLIDNAISGSEMQVDVVAALPAGTNNIGDVDVLTIPGIVGTVADDATTPGAPVMIGGMAKSPDGTDPGNVSAEDDTARVFLDLNRRLLVNDEHPRWFSYHSDGSTALTDASVQAAPGAGYQVVITDIIFSNGAATAINMFLEEATTKILGPIYLEAINGRGFTWKGKKHVTANTAVTVTTSSSTAHSVDILGYIQKV